MPQQDWFSQNAPPPRGQISPAEQSDWFSANAPNQSKAEASTPEQPGFVSRGWDASIGGLVESAKAVKDKGIVRVADEAGTAMAKRFNENPRKIGESDPNPIMRSINGITSLPTRAVDAAFGPVLDLVQDDFKSGNYAGALGTIAGTAATFFAPSALARLRAAKAAKASTGTINTMAAPAEGASMATAGPMEKAVGWANSKGLPTTRGERTGSKVYQKAERMAPNILGASDIADDFYTSRNAQIVGDARKVVDDLGGASANMDRAGTVARDQAMDVINKHGEVGDSFYDSVRKRIAADSKEKAATQEFEHAKTVKEIEKKNRLEREYWQTRKQMLYESGGNPDLIGTAKQIPIPAPPKAQLPAEMQMAPIKRSLEPLYKELESAMVDTQKASSPGWNRIKRIMEDPQEVKSAIDIDRDLGELKGLLRGERKNYVMTESGRYAMKAIDALEGEMQKAIVQSGGSEALNELLLGRREVAMQHEAASALKAVLKPGDSPANLVQRLIERGDKNVYALEDLKKVAPKAVDEIAATVLSDALDKIGRTGEGADASMKGAVADLRNLGPRTRQVFFGESAKDIESFIEHAPQLIRNMNPSGSAGALLATKAFGAGGVLLEMFHGGMGGLGMGAASLAAGAGSARTIAKWLFKPGNANDLKNAMRYANDPKTSSYFMKRLSTAVEKDGALVAALQTAHNDKASAPGQGITQEAGQQR